MGQNSPHLASGEIEIYSAVHRVLGSRIYMTDIDEAVFNEGGASSMDLETQGIKPAAIIDRKSAKGKVDLKTFSIKQQKEVAKILNVPFFVVIYFLDPEVYKTPMFLTIPMNEQAHAFIPEKANWMTVREYSLFQHRIRSLIWDGNEDTKKAFSNLKKDVGFTADTLGQLPDTVAYYPRRIIWP